MPVDATVLDPELSQENFDKLQEKLEQAFKDDPNSVNPAVLTLTKQHARLHKTLTAQAKAYTNLVEMHIRREEIAILEKLEFAETIKAYQLKLIEGKKLRNRRDRLQDIERAYADKRQEAQAATADLKKVVGSLNDIKIGMQVYCGEVVVPQSLVALNLDAPVATRDSESSTSSESQKSPNPDTENLVEPMTDVLEECLNESKRSLKLKDQEILMLKEKLKEIENREEESRKAAEEKKKVEVEEEKKKEEERRRMDDTGMGILFIEIDSLNLQLVKCYSSLATYQKTNSRLIDMLVLAEKSANMDRMQAADKIQTLKTELQKDKKTPDETAEAIRGEFMKTMNEIEKKMIKNTENVRELKANLEAMSLETFGETKKIVDGANWKAKNMQEAFAHKPALSASEKELAEKKKELTELKAQLKVLEKEYQRTLTPTASKIANDIIIHLVDELASITVLLDSQMTHLEDVTERCTQAEEDGIGLRSEFVEKMAVMTSQLVETGLMDKKELESIENLYKERETEISQMKEDLKKFTDKMDSLKKESETMLDAMKERHQKIEKEIGKGIEEEVLEKEAQVLSDADQSEEKMTLKELKNKHLKFEKSLREMERSIDPTISRLNRQLTHLFGEQQASYAVLVERYISGEDYANDERRRNADMIRHLKMQLLDGRRGKEKTKKLQEIEQEYKEKLDIVQEKHREVKKVVEEMKTELENLSMETFGEGLEEGEKGMQVLGAGGKSGSEGKSISAIVSDSLVARLFHKLSFSAGVVNTAFEKLVNQVKINMKHEETDIRMRKKGYALDIDEETNLKNIDDLKKFLLSMETTKQRMADYYADALKEADDRGIDFSLVPMDDDGDEQKFKVPTINKTAAESLAQTISNNRKTRNFFNLANAPYTGESARRLEQRLFVANLNVQERDKQLAEMKKRWEITENVLKSRHQQEIEKMKKEHEKRVNGAQKGGPPNKELEKKMAQVFKSIDKKKEEAEKKSPNPTTTSSGPAPPTQASKPKSQTQTHTPEELRDLLARAIFDAAGGDGARATELTNRLVSVFSTNTMLREEKDSEQKRILEARVVELETKNQEISEKLVESEQAYLAKERQVSVLETGFLRRGLGMTRHQLASGRIDDESNMLMKGMKNSINQYMS